MRNLTRRQLVAAAAAAPALAEGFPFDAPARTENKEDEVRAAG